MISVAESWTNAPWKGKLWAKNQKIAWILPRTVQVYPTIFRNETGATQKKEIQKSEQPSLQNLERDADSAVSKNDDLKSLKEPVSALTLGCRAELIRHVDGKSKYPWRERKIRSGRRPFYGTVNTGDPIRCTTRFHPKPRALCTAIWFVWRWKKIRGAFTNRWCLPISI